VSVMLEAMCGCMQRIRTHHQPLRSLLQLAMWWLQSCPACHAFPGHGLTGVTQPSPWISICNTLHVQ
jgi:hypothetical protein